MINQRLIQAEGALGSTCGVFALGVAGLEPLASTLPATPEYWSVVVVRTTALPPWYVPHRYLPACLPGR